MTQPDFAAALEHELQTRHVPFNLAELLEFVANVWSIAQDDPEPARWAAEFRQVACTTDR